MHETNHILNFDQFVGFTHTSELSCAPRQDWILMTYLLLALLKKIFHLFSINLQQPLLMVRCLLKVDHLSNLNSQQASEPLDLLKICASTELKVI
jgi:hypothetical protein